MGFDCQIDEPGQRDCSLRESGGYWCERVGEHGEHVIGKHTIQHALMGNGYSCESID